jgi:hypothetical protein
MKNRVVCTVAGLQRVWAARNNRFKPLYKRSYILEPAAARHSLHFRALEEIADKSERLEAFRRIPSFEADLEAADASLSAEQRLSLAQQDRARHPRLRLGPEGRTLDHIIREFLGTFANPWDLRAKEFWRPFIDELKRLGLDPVVVRNSRDSSLEVVRYGCTKKRTLSQGQFANLLSKVRKQFPRN